MPVDIATLALELTTAGMARGARESDSITAKVLANFERIEKRAKQMNDVLQSAFKLGGGSGGGSSPFTKLGSDIDKAAQSQKKLADETLRYAQQSAKLQQLQGNRAAAIQTLTTATRNHEGSVKQLLVAQTQLARLQNQGGFGRFASTVREAGESIQQTGYFLTGLSTGLIAVGAAAVKSAFDVDKNVNTLKALLGSADAAESRFAALQKLSQVTPGLTTGLAAQLDVQLRVANATEGAINKVLPAIGKLNAVSNLPDPQRFIQNLVQLVTQNFERIDLKELIGQSPLAGELIKQIFNVDSAIDSAAIREQAQKLGLTTVDAFFTAFGDAAAKNSKLANITESLSTQFAKIVDRVTIALRPLGLAIIESLGPLVERGAAIITGLGKAFGDLPKPVQQAAIVFGGLAIAIGPATVAIGAFTQAAGAIANLAPLFAAGGSLAGIGAFLAPLLPLAPVILGIAAALGIAAFAWANYESAADRGEKVTASGVKGQLTQIESLKEIKLQSAGLLVGQGKLNDVLKQLEPSTRAYIESISDESVRTRELNRVLAEQISLKEKKVLADVSDTGAAASKVEASIRSEERRLAALKALSETAAKLSQSGVSGGNLASRIQQEGTKKFGSTIGLQIGNEISAGLNKGTSAAQTLGNAIGDTTAKVGGLKNAQIQLGASVNVLFEANRRLTIDGFIEQQRAIGTSEDKIRGAVSAYEAFRQQQLASAASAAGTTSVIDQQAAAIDALRSSLEKLNQTANTDVDRRIRDIALTSRNAAEAKAKLKQNVKLDDDFAFALQNKNRVAGNLAALNEATSPTPRRSGGGASRRVESDARQIRAAEEELAKAKAAAIEAIQTRSLQSQLEAEQENFEKRIIGADAFFEARKKIELELLSLTERRIKAEASASSKRLLATKDGSPEELRELAQLVGLQSQLRIVEVERTDKIKDLNSELEKNLKLERERRAEALRTVAASVGEGLSKVGEQIQGIQKAQLEKPSVDLRKEELQLQALANAGLIRESELQDALTLARRAARSELIHSLEVEKASLAAGQDAGRFSAIQQIEEQIVALQSLGGELTRAEALQRRFTEQGILDYSRLNEGLEELLASQKGLTEIFSDFRANTVADGFGLIETGIDKLTKRLGILGDAFGQLLKDLAKLAVSKILQKLLGLDGGQSSSLGIGGAGAARSTSPLSGLGSLITGGGGSASGGGGIGGLLTGGFAGGNPAQAAIGGGSGGGGSVLGSLFGGGQGSGGGSPLGGLLGKIPGIGKLFGGSGGSSLVGGVGANIGGLPGGIQGVGSLPLTGPGGAGGAAGLGASFSGLAAGGLIAGGGLLGSLAGGKSPIGQLLGGVGGSLLGGSAAAALFNPALLPLFFSNPITAIIGGALIGGALLFRYLGGREQRKFRKTVESEYALKVDGKEKGTEVYKAVKGLGEEKFGKGKFGKNMIATIRLSKAQEALAAYGEATGQENNPLVRKFRDRKELTNPFDPRNEFIKRANGGDVRANQPYIVGDGGRSEVFVPSTAGQIYPSIAEFMREIVRPQSAQPAQSGGGWTGEAKETLRAMMGVNVRLVEALNRFESLPPEEVVRVAARRDPDTFAHANLTSIQNNSAAGNAQKQEFRKGR